MKYANWATPTRARKSPLNIEPFVTSYLTTHPPATAKTIADAVGRDALMVYRCLLRMKKRGQVTSEPSGQGVGNPHLWRLT